MSIKKTNRQQFELMVYFMRDNPWMQSRCKPRKKTMDTWKHLSNKLNSLGPPNRTIANWRGIWRDYKSIVKRKVENMDPEMGKSFNKLELITIDIMCLNDKLPDESKSSALEEDDFDEVTPQNRSTNKSPLELKEEVMDEESNSDNEHNDDESQSASYLYDIFNDDDNDEGETGAAAEIMADDNGINNSGLDTDFELNLDGKKVRGSKYNGNLKDVCDLLKENRKDMIEIEREKIFIDKAKATIERKRIELDERKLKLLGKQIELKKRKLDIEFKIVVENNAESK